MRIREIQIDGFGRFCRLNVSVPRRVGLFLGPNEAGKTTLMAFIRAILFGFEDRRSGRNRYEPLGGGTHGGALVVVDSKGREYRIERTAGRAVRGDVRVYTPEGVAAGEGAVSSLLGGISPVLYQNVFAFGLEELENLNTLKRDEVSGHIYSAGLGLGAASLVDVMRRLDLEMEELFKRGGQNPQINRRLQELERLDKEIGELRREPAEYNQVRERLRALEAELEAAQARASKLEAQARWLDKLDQAWEPWQRLTRVRARLAELPEIDAFPEAGVERLERLEKERQGVQRRREALLLRLQEARERAESLRVDEALLARRAEIRALEEERAYVARVRQTLTELETEVKSREDALAAHLRSLGPGWDEAAVVRFDVSVAVRETVRAHKAALTAAQERFRETEMRLAQARRERDRLAAEADEARKAWEAFAVPEPPTPYALDARCEALARAEKGRVEVNRLEQELRHVAERRGDLEAQLQRLRRQAEVRPRLSAAPLIVAVVAMVIAALLAAAGLPQWGAGVGAAGLAFAVAVWLMQKEALRQERARAEELHGEAARLEREYQQAGERLRQIEEKLATARAAVAEADRILAGRELATPAELAEAARALEAEREAHREKRRLHAAYLEKKEALARAERDAAEAEEVRRSAAQELERSRNTWQSWLAERGLDAKLTPDGALEVLRVVEQAAEAVRSRDAARERLQASQSTCHQFARRVYELLAACGQDLERAPGPAAQDREADAGSPRVQPDPLAAAAQLAEALKRAEEHLKERARLASEIRDMERELRELEREIGDIDNALRELLERGGADDPETFRTREGIYRERKALHDERVGLEGQLTMLARPDKDRAQLEQALESFDASSLKEALAEAAAASQKAREEYSERLREQGSLKERLSQLEKSEALALKVQEREMHRAALEEEARRWAVLALCRHVLERARERHERERQPAVLRRASHYFATMTRGEFERVVSPIGEKELYVERRGGKRLTTGALSRGTAEQLYLAMRFALVREFASRSLALPIVLDDVFVNFDPDRLRAALEVVREVSEHHQTLMFTCHPHVAEAACQVIPECEPISLGALEALGEAAAASEG